MKFWVYLFILYSQLLLAENNLKFTDDVPQSFKIFITNSLTEMSSLRGQNSTALHRQIFQGPVDGRIYLSWFLKRVKKITLSPSCNFAARIDSEGEPGVIYISKCINLNPTPDKRVYWLSILFHEARHLEPEKNFWHHSICLDSSGVPMGCDKTPLGPLGLEKILFGNIAKFCSNCSNEFRSLAQSVFDDEQVWEKIDSKSAEIIQKEF